MPYKHNDARRHKFEKAKYKVSNWSEYNDGLRKRGDITVWFTDGAIDAWVPDRVPGQKGRPLEYSELAIECCLMHPSEFGRYDNVPAPEFYAINKEANMGVNYA